MSIAVVIVGADGRMGQVLHRLLPEFSSLQLAAGVERGCAFPSAVQSPAVVIDFSLPDGFSRALEWCLAHRVALVSGTTGLDEDQHQAMRRAAASIPLLWSSNMSRGISAMTEALEIVADRLGMEADVELLETHHAGKIDAPSGTARALAGTVEQARGQTDAVISTNGSRRGPRASGEIGIAVRRGGDIAGEHTVSFYLPGECVEITHRALSRDIFARGALHAANWIADQAPGQYELADVVPN